MTIIEAINRLDALKYNTFTSADKVEWLSRLDSAVKKLIIDTHEGGENVIFTGYDQDADLNTELLVPAPFDEMYIRWMEMQIDYANGEYDKYNNSAEMYNTSFIAYERYYKLHHMPRNRGNRFIF